MEILDRSFQPMILLIEEGDRVWFSWDRFKVSYKCLTELYRRERERVCVCVSVCVCVFM